jgi:hypothetical protein
MNIWKLLRTANLHNINLKKIAKVHKYLDRYQVRASQYQQGIEHLSDHSEHISNDHASIFVLWLHYKFYKGESVSTWVTCLAAVPGA